MFFEGQPARAEDETARLERLQRQIDALQKELRVLKRQDLYRGNLGRLVLGAQYEYIQRTTFPG